MNKVINQLVATTVFAMSMNAFAAESGGSGTINFTGQITKTSCELIFPNGNNTIDLGVYPVSYFTLVGTQTLRVPFQIELKGCNDTMNPERAYLTFIGESVSVNGQLLQSTGVAMGVGVAIYTTYDPSNTKLNFSTGGITPEFDLAPTDQTTALSFDANMESFENAVGAGSVAASANILVHYN